MVDLCSVKESEVETYWNYVELSRVKWSEVDPW